MWSLWYVCCCCFNYKQLQRKQKSNKRSFSLTVQDSRNAVCTLNVCWNAKMASIKWLIMRMKFHWHCILQNKNRDDLNMTSFFTIWPCVPLVLVRSLCGVFMCLLTAVCFVSAQLAVFYSIALDGVIGAGVFYYYMRIAIIVITVIVVEYLWCHQAGAITDCRWGKSGHY